MKNTTCNGYDHDQDTGLVTRPAPPSLPAAPRYEPARNPVLVYLASLSASSRRTQAGAIRRVAEILAGPGADPLDLAWPQVTYAHAQAVRSVVAERHAPSTANRMVSVLRSVLRECWRLGWMSAEDFHRASDLRPVRGERLPSLAANWSTARSAPCSEHAGRIPRDAVMRACWQCCMGVGLRRSEAVDLDLDDVDLEQGGLIVQSGKGNKQRQVWLASGAPEVIRTWLDVRGEEQGPLLLPVLRGGRAVRRRLSAQTVLDTLRCLAKRAGVSKFSPHDARRTWISHLLSQGADAGLLCKMSGHATVQTLLRYDRRPEAARRRAGRLIHIPI